MPTADGAISLISFTVNRVGAGGTQLLAGAALNYKLRRIGKWVLIPQVITDRSGAQIIDGSLKFDQGKTQHLTRTPSSDGNKRTWTWSGWVKPAAGALGDASGSSFCCLQ